MADVKKYSFFSFIFVLIMGLSFFTAHAQVQEKMDQTKVYKLVGKVVDANSGEALSGVEVKVKHPGQQAGAQTEMRGQVEDAMTETTNDQGEFTFTELPPGEHTLKIDYEAYETWERKINLNQDSQLTIKLQPSR